MFSPLPEKEIGYRGRLRSGTEKDKVSGKIDQILIIDKVPGAYHLHTSEFFCLNDNTRSALPR